MKPSIGRIVHYIISNGDSQKIALMAGGGRLNPHGPGLHVPAIVVVVHPDGKINAQAFLDGNETLWVTIVEEGTGLGQWHWPEVVVEGAPAPAPSVPASAAPAAVPSPK